jgi:hypothetical protein
MDKNLRMEVRPGRFGVSVMLVTLYLIVVGMWLALTKKISPPPFSRVLLSYFRKQYRRKLSSYLPEQGNCFISPLPSHLISDEEGLSNLVLIEDGVPLPHGHAPHDEIRAIGAGRYSHWGANIYFAASDNSNPATNEKVYEIIER